MRQPLEIIGAIKNNWACTFHLKEREREREREKLKITAPVERSRKIRPFQKKQLEKRLPDEEVMPFEKAEL